MTRRRVIMLHRSPPRGSTSLSSKLAICCFLLRVSCSEGLLSPQFKAASKSSLALAADRVVVALTREEGKNDKLVQHIKRNPELDSQIDLLELPCIEHAGGPDFEKLGETLLSQRWDYVAVTSPEAARVVASAWDVVRDNPLPVVAVGKATEKTLQKFGIPVTFTPSKATAKVLAQELEYKGEGTTLLYPASVRAQDTLESGLMARGFAVTRLNTYDTITATWSEEQKEKAKKVKVACFASPSSIKGWLSNTGDNKDVMAACIGETSAKACRGHSWSESQIFFPESPGLEGWSNSIAESIKDLQNAVHSYSK